MNTANEEMTNYYPKTATLYSAALADGDYHTNKDAFTTFLLGLFTPFPEKMQINRAFGEATFHEYRKENFKNILDIGAGPMPRGHEWVPEAKFLCLDHNPAIVAHARRKLNAKDAVIYEAAAVGDIARLFENGLGRRVFGERPKVAICSNAVLMFVDADEIREGFTYLYEWAAPGSVLTVTMIGITAPETHFRAKMIGRFLRLIDVPMYLRHIDTFKSLLAPWTMVKGPMPTWQWLGWPPSKNMAGIGFDLYAMRLVKK